MKVSVCLITYNHERYIRQALDGVLRQDVDFPWEVVIGEDCSTDGTAAVVREYAGRFPHVVRVLDTPHNLGLNGKGNLARTLAACTGEYVALLEGDDYWIDPHKLRRQVTALDRRRDWALCFHPVRCEIEGRPGKTTVFPSAPPVEPLTLRHLLARNLMQTCSVVFRNKLFDALPDWWFRLPMGDWPLHILNAQYGDIGFVPDVMGVYRVHARGLWSMTPEATKVKAAFALWAALERHLPAEYGPDLAGVRDAHLDWLLAGARFHPSSLVRTLGGTLRAAAKKLTG